MAQILLIDDDDSIRDMLRQTLTHYGHHVTEASNGKEGLKLFPGANVDLVITDLVMPEMEGFEVLAELRKKHPLVKIIVISGGVRGSVDNYLEIARHMGAARVFAKPFSHAVLLAAIDELLPAGGTQATPA